MGATTAVTERADDIVTEHTPPDVESQPNQLENTDDAPAPTVSVATCGGVVLGTSALHPVVAPVAQLMPTELPVTVPIPPPDIATASRYVLGWKVAVTVLGADIDTVQVSPDAESQPDQREKIDAVPGVAVSVTTCGGVVFATLALHPVVEPLVQARPTAAAVTVPEPVPGSETESG